MCRVNCAKIFEVIGTMFGEKTKCSIFTTLQISEGVENSKLAVRIFAQLEHKLNLAPFEKQ